jgi:isoprenylcysteine carboxyl methyltransferase (ICMT) family protein YpbQ
VIGELLGVALLTGAIVTGPLAVLGFGSLILRRIGVEERALAGSLRAGRSV